MFTKQLGSPLWVRGLRGQGSPGNCFGGGKPTFAKASSPAPSLMPPPLPPWLLSCHQGFLSLLTCHPSQSHVLRSCLSLLAGHSSHPEAHASFRGPFSSLPSTGDSSPTLAGLPTRISEGVLGALWEGSQRSFTDAEASTLQGKADPQSLAACWLGYTVAFLTPHWAPPPRRVSRKPCSVKPSPWASGHS